MITTTPIKLNNMLMSDTPERKILRGDLDRSTLLALKIEWYQRGNISSAKLRKLQKTATGGAEFPDITLGVRGHNVHIDGTQSAMIWDDCYVVDGLQRWTAVCLALEQDANCLAHLGAKAFLDTNVEFERELFRKMNTGHTSMAASVILRNEKEVSRVAATLVGLADNDKKFMLYKRVAWEQEVRKETDGDLLRGIILLRVLATLHHHRMRSAPLYGQVLALLAMCDRNIDVIGLQQGRENLITFFEAVDEAWGIRDVALRYGTIHLSDVWLRIFARLLSDHREFWRDDTELFIPKPLMRDIKRIRPNDPELVALVRGGKIQHELLYQTFLNTINHGKSANRLVNRWDLEKAEQQASRFAYTGQTTSPS
jgi:hypothetical protein